MRRFELHRRQDTTGRSGTGVVAQGCQFDNGRVAMTWMTSTTSCCWYDAISDVQSIHQHGNHTDVMWLDNGRTGASAL